MREVTLTRGKKEGSKENQKEGETVSGTERIGSFYVMKDKSVSLSAVTFIECYDKLTYETLTLC